MTRAAPEDPRAARTRARLREALLAECAERPLEEVGVAALVRRAEVGRATFYVHYDGLEALAVDACADVVRDAVEALHAWRGRPDPVHAPPALAEFFGSLTPHTALYRSLLAPGGGGPLGRVLHRDLRAYSLRERELAGAADAPWSPPRSPPPSPAYWPTGCTDCSTPAQPTSPTRSGSCWSRCTRAGEAGSRAGERSARRRLERPPVHLR